MELGLEQEEVLLAQEGESANKMMDTIQEKCEGLWGGVWNQRMEERIGRR